MLNCLLFLILVSLAEFPNVSAAQKPVIEAPIVGDVYNPPTTLEAMLARADAVVIAVLSKVSDRPDQAKRLPRTEYEADIIAIVQDHQRLDQKLRFCRPGVGTLEYEDRIVRRFQPGMQDLPPGRQVLLFLSWDEASTCYQLAFGAASVAGFDENGKVADFVGSPALRELDGLETSELVKRLRMARKKLEDRR